MLDLSRVTTLGFDYGNTLISFGPAEVAAMSRSISVFLTKRHGSVDEQRLAQIRSRQIVAPYSNGFRENSPKEVVAELLRELYGKADPTEVQEMVRLRREDFVALVRLPPEVPDILNALSKRYRLILVSNYPCGQAIRESLDRLDLTRFFASIAVSADCGFVKPDPRPFRAALDPLGLRPEECIYTGDNWLADIQGAKRLGMQAILTRQYVSYEKFEAQAGDFEADLRIERLADVLPALLQVSPTSPG